MFVRLVAEFSEPICRCPPVNGKYPYSLKQVAVGNAWDGNARLEVKCTKCDTQLIVPHNVYKPTFVWNAEAQDDDGKPIKSKMELLADTKTGS